MPRRYAVASALLAALIASSCATLKTPPSVSTSTGENALGDAKVVAWDAPIAGRARVEVWIRAGSLDGGAPQVAATMAEIWAARTGAETWVTPSLTVLAIEAPHGELEEATERLLRSLSAPPTEAERDDAARAVRERRRRQSHAPEREAIAAAFSAMGLRLALPLGEEDDPEPSDASLRAYLEGAIGPESVRVLFIGEIPEGLAARTERVIDRLERPSSLPASGEESERPLGFHEAQPAWALVATLGSLEVGERVRALLESGPLSLGEARVELAPSHLGAFLVVSGRGGLSPDRLRAWVLEIRRLASWIGPVGPGGEPDLLERARLSALHFGAARASEVPPLRFHLGVAARSESEVERDRLERALAAELEPAPVEHDDARDSGTSVVARFPALFSGEPASDAGRGALLLRALGDDCARSGLEVSAASVEGDGVLAFTFTEPPRLDQVQTLARCLLRDAPDAHAWEAVRAKLLDELARDPLHPALEALAAGLYPSAPSSAVPLQTRALRHRSGDGRMAEALARRRAQGAIRFAVSGASSGMVAAQLGSVLAAMPTARAPRPLEQGRPELGPSVVELDAPGVFAAGVRLDARAEASALAFAASWARRARERGLFVTRALSGGHATEGFAALVVPAGGSDPETLRALLEAAMPSESEFHDALLELERAWAYRPRVAGERPIDADAAPLPRVTGRAYVIGSGPR